MKTRRVLALIMTVAMLLSLLGPSLALAEAELLPDDVDIIALDGEAVDLPNFDDLGDLDLGDLVIDDVEPGADLDGADMDAPDAGEETSADGGIAMASYYAVTFDTQGGEPVPELQMVEEGGYAQRPEDPTRDRSAFTGWYLDGEDYFANPTPINSDVTLTAGWEVEQLEQEVGEKPDEEPGQQLEEEIEIVDQSEGEPRAAGDDAGEEPDRQGPVDGEPVHDHLQYQRRHCDRRDHAGLRRKGDRAEGSDEKGLYLHWLEACPSGEDAGEEPESQGRVDGQHL